MSKQQTNPQADSLGFWIFRLNRAMFAEFSARLAAFGVTGAEWTILSQIGPEGTTPVALANYMAIDRAAVTRFIDQLERKRLVCRTPHPADRRSTLLTLSDAGKKLMPKLIAASQATNQSFLAHLPQQDARTLLMLLRQLGERLPQQVFPVKACKK